MEKGFNLKIIGLISFSVSILLVLIWYLMSNNIKVVSTSPANKEQQVSLEKPLVVYFNRNLSQSQIDKMQVISEPSVGLNKEWSEANKSLTLMPNGKLESNTNYRFRINLNGNLYSWSFETTKDDSQDFIEQGKSDNYFSVQEKKFNTSNPWYSVLPHRTNDYFLTFDPQNDKFYSDIYTVDKSENEIKNDVLNYLKSIGVNTNRYQIEFNAYVNRPYP